ncbi:hypothetical protein [Klebsiella quasipneumoniae]|uniref:hypothetical protein n=1 Tax=Klebsiella quasipneumoniae TaxID=1463165 RepID=UPI000F25788F|nr:hypothetical protein [Klebsiella quasipneumoniae]VCW92736.1 hypothetical protein BANRA_01449 [Klebsiella quasipneumoniae]
MSEFSRETLLNIIETDHVQCGEASALARMALAAMDSESECLPLDYLHGHKDGLEWAAQLAEANHPETGDWLYDDPIELAKAIRKGTDMPPAQPVADSEPVAWLLSGGGTKNVVCFDSGNAYADPLREVTPLYRHAQPETVENHIGSKNALDAIVSFIKSKGNPTVKCYEEVSEQLFKDNCHGIHSHIIEYILKLGEELEDLRAEQDESQLAAVVPDERDKTVDAGYHPLLWSFNEGRSACRAAMLQASPVCTCPSGDGSLRWPCPVHAGSSPAIPDGYVMVPKVATEKMLIAGLEEADPLGSLIDWDASRGDCNTREQVQGMFEAMLAAAPQEVKGD